MTQNAEIQTHKLPSALASLARVEQIIEELKSTFGIPEELYGNILISLSEAINNAIRHGNQLDQEKHVDLSFEFGEKAINFIVQDQGKGFDFENVPDPTHPDNIDKPDGRGIFIMKSLTDEVVFDNNGSVVRLSFIR